MGFLRKYRFIGYGLLVVGVLACVPLAVWSQSVGAQMNAESLARNSGWIAIAILAFGGILFLLIGVPWTTLVLTFPDQEQARASYGRTTDAFGAVFLFVLLQIVLGIPLVIVMAIIAIVTNNPGLMTPAGVIAPALLISAGSMLLILYTRGLRTGAVSWKDFSFSLAGGKNILIGIGGGLAALAIATGVELGLQAVGVQQSQMAIFPGADSTLLVKVITLLGGAVLAPVVEEIFFRGFVFRGLLVRQGALRAYFISATFFSLAHTNLEAFLPIFVSALCLAFLYKWTGSLIPPIIAHSVNNAIALLMHLFS